MLLRIHPSLEARYDIRYVQQFPVVNIFCAAMNEMNPFNYWLKPVRIPLVRLVFL